MGLHVMSFLGEKIREERFLELDMQAVSECSRQYGNRKNLKMIVLGEAWRMIFEASR